MRVVYMGTPDFAVPSLEALVKNNYDVQAVFTQPDKPKGRGKKLANTPVKEKALEYGIPVEQPRSLRDNEIIDRIRAMRPEVIIVVAYGQILPKEILDIPPLGCINVHASLLPKYRGAGPINWAIINGEKKTGITTMYMDVGLDTGDMILKEETPISDNETAGELHDKLAVLGARILVETLGEIQLGKAPRIKQREEDSSYAPMLTKELGVVNWRKPAQEIHNLIRGTIPWPTAYTSYKGEIIKIWKSRVEPAEGQYEPGEIIKASKEGIYIGTGKDILIIEELQFSGKKRLSVKDYLVGNTIDNSVILGESYGA